MRWDRVGRLALLCVLVALIYLYVSAGVRMLSTLAAVAPRQRRGGGDGTRTPLSSLRQHEDAQRPARARSRGAPAGHDAHGRAALRGQRPARQLRPPRRHGRRGAAAGAASLGACPSRTRSTSGTRASGACAAHPAERRALLERVTEALVAELRRRLGGRFSTEELVELYEAGTAWCLQAAMRVAPEEPWAWEAGVVVDAAFATLPARGRRLRRAGAGEVEAPEPPLLVVLAHAADDDPVLLDGDLDRPVAGPVLGVDRVVLDRRVEPQAVALLAVVEGALERRGVARAGAPAAPATAAAPARPGLASRPPPRRPPRRPRRLGGAPRAPRSASASAASSSAAISASSSARRSISSG